MLMVFIYNAKLHLKDKKIKSPHNISIISIEFSQFCLEALPLERKEDWRY